MCLTDGERRSLAEIGKRLGKQARRVQKHKRTQDRPAGTFRIGQAQATLDLMELEYVSDRDGGFKQPLERCKLLTRWAFEYFDQTVIGVRARKLDGTDALRESSARDRPIAEPVPRRLVSANFENASRIPTFGCLGAQLAISVHNCPVLADSRFPMSIFKRTQRKYVKKAYRVRNWREYEAGLRNRGSLTVWISLTAGKLVNWDAPRPRRRKPGRQRKYSNHAIETAVTLGMVFHLSSRQSEGLLRSLFALMKLDNDVPDHTTISRRKPNLGKVPFYQVKQKTPLHILFDSSGLAVHAGQLRRAQKSRDYRKLHLCVDEQSGEVVAGELTSKRARDSSRVASLVGQSDSPISSARADTAYDASGVYEAIENHSAHRSPRVLIPPRKGAQLASGPASSRQRNRNIAAQARLGKRKWHTESGYSKRSKVETTFHRYKAYRGLSDASERVGGTES